VKPPALQLLAVALPRTGNAFVISVNSTKPGTLYYAASLLAAAAPTRTQLLRPATYAAANFSGQAMVAVGGAVVNVTLCVASSASFQLWAVQEDLEGQFAGRQPNYSPVTR
jgi:hypothetical protein